MVDEDEIEESVHIARGVYCVSTEVVQLTSQFNNNDILLDNQATVSIFNNKNLLTNIHHSKNTINIIGIGGGITTNLVGYYCKMPSIKVYYSPDSTANILSFKDVTTEYAVEYQRIKDCFTVKLNNDNNDNNNNIMTFKQLIQ